MNNQVEDEVIEIQRNDNDFWFACVDIDVLRDNELSIESRFIFALICTFASTMVGRRWVDIDTITKLAGGMPRDMVKMTYLELERKGLLTLLYNRSGYGHEEDTYGEEETQS